MMASSQRSSAASVAAARARPASDSRSSVGKRMADVAEDALEIRVVRRELQRRRVVRERVSQLSLPAAGLRERADGGEVSGADARTQTQLGSGLVQLTRQRASARPSVTRADRYSG